MTSYLIPDFGSGNTGSLNYSIGFPSSVRGWLGLYPIDDTMGTSREIDISTGAGGSASDTLTGLAEGSYRGVINLYDRGNNRAAAWTGAVHIVGGSTTSLAHVFTAADFAECPPIAGEGAATLAGKLDAALGSSAGAYTVVLEGTETDLGSFTPKTLNVTEGRDIRITVRGNGNTVTLSSSSEGSLFTLGAGSGSSLGLELHDLTLVGRTNNNASMVQVISGGSLEMKAGSRITGNSSYSAYGGGVYVYSSGTFTKQPGAVIYGSNESVSALRNTTGANGHAVYVGGSPPKTRYTAAGTGITLDSSLGGSAGDWEEPLPSTSSDGISGITYSSVSGGEWTVQSDGRRKSPSIAHSGATKTRVSFTSAAANANITIALDVSSESGYDFAFISTLDNGSATYSSGYYTGSRISGTVSVTVSIPVPAAGSLNGK